MVYLFVLHRLVSKCTKIYNSCRTIVRLIKPFVFQRFRRCRCGLYEVPAVEVYKKSQCRLISVLFLVIEKFQNTRGLIIFYKGKFCTIRPWKCPEIHTGIFGRMESAQDFCFHLVCYIYLTAINFHDQCPSSTSACASTSAGHLTIHRNLSTASLQQLGSISSQADEGKYKIFQVLAFKAIVGNRILNRLKIYPSIE